LYAYNKIDTITIEDVDKLAREPDAIVISVRHKLNLEVKQGRKGAGGGE